jgi:uncharacterized membrane protein YdjX (TVP38/TMEM64 family)
MEGAVPFARLRAARAFVADLGPLRWVVLASAVLPTSGLIVVLANVAAIAHHWPEGSPGAALAIGAIAVALAALLLPPSIAAFAAGYVFGPARGALLAAPAIATGALLGVRFVWPLLGARLFPFMQGREKLETARAFCAARPWARVALLRLAATVPFSVVNLLLAAARVPSAAVLGGSLLAALPVAWLAAGAGAAYRHWHDRFAFPADLLLANLIAAGIAALTAVVLARRRWRTWRRARAPH